MRMKTTTPSALQAIDLLGGQSCEGITFSKDEVRAIKKLYKFKDDSEDNVLIKAGNTRNALRWAQNDGFRLIGYLAKYLTPDDDPLKMLIQTMSEAGYDISPEDYEWAFNDKIEWDEDDE